MNANIRRLRNYLDNFKVTSIFRYSTNKYLPFHGDGFSKDNEKEKNHKSQNHKQQPLIKNKLKLQQNTLLTEKCTSHM